MPCLMWLAEAYDWIYHLAGTNMVKAYIEEKKGEDLMNPQVIINLRHQVIHGVALVLAVIQLLDSSKLFSVSIYNIAMNLQKKKDQITGPGALSFSMVVGCAFHYYEKAIGNKIVPVRRV